MNLENVLEIPRYFTAIAESLACIIYILPLKKRHFGSEHLIYLLAGPITFFLIHIISGQLPLIYWIPGMLTAMFAMFLYIRSVCDISGYDAGFLFVRAFILAEFVAAIEWQIYYYLLYKGMDHNWRVAIMIMAAIYIPVFALVYFIDARKVFKDRRLGISFKEMINAMIIGIATFSTNNMNFIVDTPFVSRQIGANILYIRTLVDFCGVLVLFAWNEQRREMNLDHELKTMNDILHRRYDQYQASKESIDLINRKYHDLKHQIAVLKNEKDPLKREEYFEELDHAMAVYESQYDTGNTVVDTILSGKCLYCNENDINISCVVDGELLNFMMVMDVCSVIGNALDNCIEGVRQIEDKEKRIIRMAVFSKNSFLMMRFENYYEQDLIFDNGMPITTKVDGGYHGYGIKSIKKTIEKYNGNLSITANNNWFDLKVLIPLGENI